MMINLYSDTQSLPTEGMREAIARAEVGDEQKGQDRSVTRLIEKVAHALGKQTGMFLPSGTMCNAVAAATHCGRGEAVIAESGAHIVRYESGGLATFAGAMLEPIAGTDGKFTGAQVLEAASPGSRYTPRTTLMCVEQSCNLAGGTVWSMDQLEDVVDAAQSVGLRTHMDGARLFNAAVSTGIPASALCAGFDSVWVDFTKGLGAPFGAVLCGTEEFIERAWVWKHRFGGAMRQAGFMAAGCLYALEHQVDRLVQDHRHAQLLNEKLSAIDGIVVRYASVQTNIVYFDFSAEMPRSAPDFLKRCEERGLRLGRVGQGFRAVTYLDISKADVLRAADIVADVMATCVRGSAVAA